MAEKDESLENLPAQEFSEDEYRNMGKLYSQLVGNPKTREFTLRATKHIAPQTSIPEIDVLDRVGSAMKPHLERLTKAEQRLVESDTKNSILEKRQALYEKGYSKDDVSAMEKIMTEKHIPSYETAAEFYDAQRKSATPTPASWNSPNKLPIDKDKSKAAGGFKKFFIQDAHQALDDLHAGRVKLNS